MDHNVSIGAHRAGVYKAVSRHAWNWIDFRAHEIGHPDYADEYGALRVRFSTSLSPRGRPREEWRHTVLAPRSYHHPPSLYISRRDLQTVPDYGNPKIYSIVTCQVMESGVTGGDKSHRSVLRPLTLVSARF